METICKFYKSKDTNRESDVDDCRSSVCVIVKCDRQKNLDERIACSLIHNSYAP